MIAAAGATVAADVEHEAPIETRVLDSGFEAAVDAERQTIFVVCTIRAGVDEICQAPDLAVATNAFK